MPELRDDTTDDGFHEIQFTRKQLVFLFMTASAGLILVFILGVLAGRGMASRVEDPIGLEMSMPPAPSVPPEQGPAPGEPLVPPQGDLTYPTSLSGNTGGTARPEPPAPVDPPETRPVDPPATKPAEPPVTEPAAEPVQPTAAAGPKVPTAASRQGAWVIQIYALKSRQPAAAKVQELVEKGYPAFLESSAPGVFRVRVGRFKDRSEAEQMARRLQKEERLPSVISR